MSVKGVIAMGDVIIQTKYGTRFMYDKNLPEDKIKVIIVKDHSIEVGEIPSPEKILEHFLKDRK
ncbi:hypothetical protein [Thermococcus sp. P6]|uniref:hypothetical protein n=1 Tax=Thermococcus sp. P6 TaxID=122420 RepID=UPI0018DF3686|nr:hypothetical protein [Thermococcus sp. P6]